MYGGAGADTFRFTSLADFGPATHPDTIGDFNAAEGDIIDLLGVDADIRDGFAGDQAFTFIGSDKFSHSAGELRASGSGGYLTVSGDVNGDGQADFAFIVKAAVLHHSDFIL